MPRVVHFEIHADDPDRAAAFYRAVFDWRIDKWESDAGEYWLVATGADDAPGINGGLMRRRGPPPTDGAPLNAFGCTVDVDDVDAYAGRVAANGGAITVPKMAVPQVGWVAYAKDTEGNIFGMFQTDESAR